MEALAIYNLGELNRTAQKFEAARGYYRQSLALHQELQDAVMEAHCLAGEAECLARDGRRGMARALLDRSRTLSTEETPYLLRAQAWLCRSEGDQEKARLLFAKALQGARIQAPEIVRELKEAARCSVAAVVFQRLRISRVRSSARGRPWVKAATAARMAACTSSEGWPSRASRRSSPKNESSGAWASDRPSV